MRHELPRHLRLALGEVEREIDAIFSELIETPWGRGGAPSTAWPPVDVYETDDAYVVLVDLPGVECEDVRVDVDGPQFTVCGSRWSTGFAREGRDVFVERRHGRFCRTFELEHVLDPNRIERGCHNGIFWVRIGKRRTKPAGAAGAAESPGKPPS